MNKSEKMAKAALLSTINDLINEFGPVYFDGYENESQRIKFDFDRHKCKLLEVNAVNMFNGTITLTMLAKGVELKEWEDIRLNMIASHFRYETLLRIVKDVYMCGPACGKYGDDFDSYIKEKLANFFDTFGENW